MATTIAKKRHHFITPLGSDERSQSGLFNCAMNGASDAPILAVNERAPADLPIPSECRQLIRCGALVAVNSLGGKDSQAMTILLLRLVPRDQIFVVYAPLGEVEWPGTIEHIENTIPPGVPLIMAPVTSGKTLLEQVEERGMWPSNSARWCTSGTKRGPIERELRRYLKAHPRLEGRLVNALGLRRDESRDRARRIPWRRNERMSVAGRVVFDWLPIFDLTTEDVFRVIAEDGQSPHPVYSLGLTRCSCSFCIFASRSDLRRAAELRPDLYAKYAQLEWRIAHTLSPTRKYLPELTGIPVDSAVRMLLRPRGLKGDPPTRPRARSVSR